MSTTNASIPPSLRLLPLAADARELFARAIHLARHPAVADEVRGWLEQHYSESAVRERLLPELEEDWNESERELKIAPSPSELRAHNAIKDRGSEGRARWRGDGYTCQDYRNKREWRRQHQEAMRHPNYSAIMNERRGRLKLLKEERHRWHPTLPDRLILAVNEFLAVPFLPGADLVSHSREIVAIAALLMPESLPELGELGLAAWENTHIQDAPASLGDSDDDVPLTPKPHFEPPDALLPRNEGRAGAMFDDYESELKLSRSFPLDALLTHLLPAVETLEAELRRSGLRTMSRAEAAKHLGCDPGHISRLLQRGVLRRAPSEADELLVDAASVEAYAASRQPRRKSSSPTSATEGPGLHWDCANCDHSVISVKRPTASCKCGRRAWVRRPQKPLPPE